MLFKLVSEFELNKGTFNFDSIRFDCAVLSSSRLVQKEYSLQNALVKMKALHTVKLDLFGTICNLTYNEVTKIRCGQDKTTL